MYPGQTSSRDSMGSLPLRLCELPEDSVDSRNSMDSRTLWTHRTPWTPGAFRLKTSADSSGPEPIGAVTPQCTDAFPGPCGRLQGPQLPFCRASPSSGEPEALPALRWPQACRIWEASGVRARERPNPSLPGPAPEGFKRFKSALTEISFTLLRKGGAQDAKLY